ncbi:MAG TPA: hypothetical protein V6D06_03665 [Trichocoleus sp.]
MTDHPRQQRQSAARDFMQSLGQLEAVLKTEAEAASTQPPPAPRPQPAAPPTPTAPQSALEAALEDAAADIEQYMNTHDA